MFAAAAPAAGPADPRDATLYASQNIWAINGTTDSTAADNTAAINGIRMAGGNPIYTLLQGRGHDTWRSVYKDPQFIAWMYAQRRGVPWWQHPPAAPTTLQPDPANGSTTLSGGVSTVPPAGLGPTTPFPNGMGAGGMSGAGGMGGMGGVSTGGVTGESGSAGATVGGSAGQIGGGSAGSSMVAGAGGTSATAGGSSVAGVSSIPAGAAPSGGGAGGAGVSAGDAGVIPDPDFDEEGGCSVGRTGTDASKSIGGLLLLALLMRAQIRRRKAGSSVH